MFCPDCRFTLTLLIFDYFKAQRLYRFPGLVQDAGFLVRRIYGVTPYFITLKFLYLLNWNFHWSGILSSRTRAFISRKRNIYQRGMLLI